MCTAVTYNTKDHYFGRNLDLEYSYEESVTITPRNYTFHFRKKGDIHLHYALIGMAYVVDDYPLYYDATNEMGLSMAGLNFPDNTLYRQENPDKDNITPFEFIPWILSQCANIEDTKKLLSRINLVKINFSDNLPLSPLHWMISDRNKSIVVECVKDGLKVYDNPVHVLTNNPPFPYHLTNINNYMSLSKNTPVNNFSHKLNFNVYSRGMGAIGLPGDLSSSSRFIRAAFVRNNAVSANTENESVSQFFHILSSVEQQRGCVQIDDNLFEITVYSSCCNTDKGIYYYKTYDNWEIKSISMHEHNLLGRKLISYNI